MKAFIKIDKFYLSIVVLLILLALYGAFIARNLIASMGVAQEVDESFLNAPQPHLQRSNLGEAYSSIFEKQVKTLDLKD